MTTGVTLGIPYTDPVPADTQGNLLDVYPVEGSGPAPLLIWSRGSAWLKDNGRDGAARIAEVFNPRGYVVAGVSVRSSAQVRYPGQLHDVRAAIRFLRRNAGEYGIGPERVAIMGASSGGWLAAMAALAGHHARLDGEVEVGGLTSDVQAAVCFFPPVDFLAMDRHTAEQKSRYELDYLPTILHDDPASPESLLIGGAVQDHPDAAREAGPLAHVTSAAPPIHIVHGTADPLLPPGGSEALYQALKEAGTATSLTLVEGGGHLLEPGPDLGLPGAPIIDAADFTTRRYDQAEGERERGHFGPTWSSIGKFLDEALRR